MCDGGHEAWSQQCPARRDELARTKALYANRPHYHPVPAGLGTRVQLWRSHKSLCRKRSARKLGQPAETNARADAGRITRGHKRINTKIGSGVGTDKENEPPGGLSSTGWPFQA